MQPMQRLSIAPMMAHHFPFVDFGVPTKLSMMFSTYYPSPQHVLQDAPNCITFYSIYFAQS